MGDVCKLRMSLEQDGVDVGDVERGGDEVGLVILCIRSLEISGLFIDGGQEKEGTWTWTYQSLSLGLSKAERMSNDGVMVANTKLYAQDRRPTGR